jgi:hypothetical protein
MSPRLLRLGERCRCPVCGARPPLRVEPDEAERYNGDPPERRVATVKCPRILKGGKRCGTVYEIRAGDFQDAA